MSIAVIIPLYNGAPWIREALDTVLAQEVAPEEVVVVDDGSSDGSPGLVQTYPQVRLLTNPAKGPAAARNFGLRQTKSAFVAFLDQDDVWHPSHLRLMTKALQRSPEAGAVLATACCFGRGSPEYRTSLAEATYFDPWKGFPFTVGVDGASLALIRRTTLKPPLIWEEHSTGMGDHVLFLKFSVSHPLLHLSCCTVGKRVHSDSQWASVRDWGATYLGLRYRAMRGVLDFRRRELPADPALPIYERRLGALQALQRLTEAVSSSDFKEVPLLGRQLERGLRTDPPEYLPHAFYCLVGALFPIHDNERLRIERDGMLRSLLVAWPEDAYRTRVALQGVIGEPPRVS